MAELIKSREPMTEREYEVLQAFRELSRRQVETPTQKEIADFIAISQPTVFRALSGLEEKGFIGSERATKARRHRSYRITDFRRNGKKR